MNIIETLEAEEVARLTAQRAIPEFQPGDTLVVNVKVKEGERTRVQAYEGVCIARANSGLHENFTVRKISYGEGVERVFPIFSPNIDSIKEGERSRVQAYEGVVIARTGGGIQESFTVRKISYGEGVERVFPLYSPNIDSIKVVRRGKVRRAKLYYLRDRRGKSARIAERVDTVAKAKNLAKAKQKNEKSAKATAAE